MNFLKNNLKNIKSKKIQQPKIFAINNNFQFSCLDKNSSLTFNKNYKPNEKFVNKFFKFSKLNFSNSFPVNLAVIGEGTKEAEIKQWFFKVGDEVDEDDKLVELSTDKQVAEIPCPIKGIISKINYEEGEICQVGHSLCEIIAESSEKIDLGKTENIVEENTNQITQANDSKEYFNTFDSIELPADNKCKILI